VTDHLVTLVAYAVVAVLVGVAFWRAQRGTIKPAAHGVVSVIFGLLWPLSVPYQAGVRALNRVLTRRRMRRGVIEEPALHR
jgi:lipopolysaccharide export LptBFGC system permease protein LptF